MTYDIPDLTELKARSHVVRLPLVHRFRGIHVREVMIFEGSHGLGEWSAFTEYDDQTATIWLESALEQAYGPRPSKDSNTSRPIPVNATFPSFDDVNEIPGWWQRFPGCTSAKIKVAESTWSHDLDVIQRASESGPQNGTIRLDANGRWSVDQALTAIQKSTPFRIDYVEQPVATVDEMAFLKGEIIGSGVRLAVDELIRDQSTRDEVLDPLIADVAVLKVSPLGGIRRTLDIARQAQQAGLQVTISSALDTSVGLAWSLYAASALRERGGALNDSGLGTSVFFKEEVVSKPVEVIDGAVTHRYPELNPQKLARLEAPKTRIEWWHHRLERCLAGALERISGHDNLPIADSYTPHQPRHSPEP